MTTVTVANIKSVSNIDIWDTNADIPAINIVIERLIATRKLQMWYDINTGSLVSDKIANILISSRKRIREINNRLLAKNMDELQKFVDLVKDEFNARFYIAPNLERKLQKKEINYKIIIYPKIEYRSPVRKEWLSVGKAITKFAFNYGRLLKYIYNSKNNHVYLSIAVKLDNSSLYLDKLDQLRNNFNNYDNSDLYLKLDVLEISVKGEIETPKITHCIKQIEVKKEDRIHHELIETNQGTIAFSAVFDGHGGNGTVNYLMDNIKRFSKLIEQFPTNAAELTSKATQLYKTLDDEIYRKNLGESGSTATLVFHNLTKQEAYFINLGDSRTVCQLPSGLIIETKDHKPDDPKEKSRILKAGGEVTAFRIPRINGSLAVSRSFGDHALKKPVMTNDLVSVKPVIVSDKIAGAPIKMQSGTVYILASDGLWDVLSTAESLDIAKNSSFINQACADLVNEAQARGSRDDISVILVKVI